MEAPPTSDDSLTRASCAPQERSRSFGGSYRRRAVGTRSLVRSALLLVVAATALLFGIAGLGDARRRNNALNQATARAAVFTERMGASHLLPLNLEPGLEGDDSHHTIPFESLSSQEVRLLRGRLTGNEAPQRVAVAWSVSIVQSLGRDGRAVVFFEAGRFDGEWVSPVEFDAIHAAQRRTIAVLQSGGVSGG